MKNFRCFLVLGCFLFVSYNAHTQNKIKLSNDKLLESFNKLKNEASFESKKKEYHFLSNDDFENIYSPIIVNETIKILNKIKLPFAFNILKHIRLVRCYYGTDSYSTWYISMANKNHDYYFFTYEDNLGLDKIPLVGKQKNTDYVWEIANQLLQNRDDKNGMDHLLIGEIENGEFTTLKATQNFYFGDDVFFKMIIALIGLKKCK